MKTEKKNQHYIPKFYLRNFSYQGNQKQIGVFNIINEKFIQRAKLKTQGSKNFFYGEDGQIEDSLATIEGTLASAIKKIITTEQLPKKLTPDHLELLTFVTLTDFRNPVRIQSMIGLFDKMKERLKELDPNFDSSKIIPKLSHDETIKQTLSFTHEICDIIADLDFKLLVNSTSTPFITSDYPIVKYNQYLEQKKWLNSKTGYGVTGLQILIPLTSKLTILFFDSKIYRVGYRKRKHLHLTSKNDIDEINLLYFLNCFDTVFFNHAASEHYIRRLFAKSTKYKRANLSQAELNYLVKSEDDFKQMKSSGNKNLMIINNSDCETSLTVSGIKLHSQGKSHKLHPSMTPLRPHAERIRKSSR